MLVRGSCMQLYLKPAYKAPSVVLAAAAAAAAIDGARGGMKLAVGIC